MKTRCAGSGLQTPDPTVGGNGVEPRQIHLSSYDGSGEPRLLSTHCRHQFSICGAASIIRQNGGGVFSSQTSGLVCVVVQYLTRPSCVATSGNPGSANDPRIARSQNSDGPGYSFVVAIRVASWFTPSSASSFATAAFCWSSVSARRACTTCVLAPESPDANEEAEDPEIHLAPGLPGDRFAGCALALDLFGSDLVVPGEGDPERKADGGCDDEPARDPVGQTERRRQLRDALRERLRGADLEQRGAWHVAAFEFGEQGHGLWLSRTRSERRHQDRTRTHRCRRSVRPCVDSHLRVGRSRGPS